MQECSQQQNTFKANSGDGNCRDGNQSDGLRYYNLFAYQVGDADGRIDALITARSIFRHPASFAMLGSASAGVTALVLMVSEYGGGRRTDCCVVQNNHMVWRSKVVWRSKARHGRARRQCDPKMRRVCPNK